MGTNKKLSRPPLVPAIPVGMEPKIVEDIEPKFQRETYPDPRYVAGSLAGVFRSMPLIFED